MPGRPGSRLVDESSVDAVPGISGVPSRRGGRASGGRTCEDRHKRPTCGQENHWYTPDLSRTVVDTARRSGWAGVDRLSDHGVVGSNPSIWSRKSSGCCTRCCRCRRRWNRRARFRTSMPIPSAVIWRHSRYGALFRWSSSRRSIDSGHDRRSRRPPRVAKAEPADRLRRAPVAVPPVPLPEPAERPYPARWRTDATGVGQTGFARELPISSQAPEATLEYRSYR